MQGGEDGVRVGGGFGFLCVVAGEAFVVAGEYGVFFGVLQLGEWGWGPSQLFGGKVRSRLGLRVDAG